MTLESKLAELAERRARFVEFRDAVDADLARQRVERLSAETAGIQQLVVECAAEDATIGQIKRAYDTKDHRTISDIIRSHGPEIAAIKAGKVARLRNQPEWFTLDADGTIHVSWEESQADYTYSTLEDGQFLFSTESSRWDDSFTIENKAVNLLDGKTETESAEGRVLAKFIRKHNTDNSNA